LDNFALSRANFNQVAVQVADSSFEAHQRFFKSYGDGCVKIVSLSVKLGMLVLLDHEDHVTRNHIWFLLALAFKHYLIVVRHALLDRHFEFL